MAPQKKTLRTCPKGHKYYKSSDCPTCPVCEEAENPKEGFLSHFSAPARRALEGQGISTAKHLAMRTEKEIMALHGIGKASLPTFKTLLKKEKLDFKKTKASLSKAPVKKSIKNK